MTQELKSSAQTILGLIDLTALNDNDTDAVINQLCQNAKTQFGNVAAVCIYSRFVPLAKEILTQDKIQVATVANFPHGQADFELAMFEVELALDRGADEVDIVFPYHTLIAGEQHIAEKMLSSAKALCQKQTLKVIIESGKLHTPHLIKLASKICIDNGADFIKTSTGKVEVNATLDAATIMLKTLHEHKSNCGFKAAGGIKTVIEAQKYLELASQIMGSQWINAKHFRFGASSLLNDVLNVLSNSKTIATDTKY